MQRGMGLIVMMVAIAMIAIVTTLYLSQNTTLTRDPQKTIVDSIGEAEDVADLINKNSNDINKQLEVEQLR